ncbi:MAG: hypothetical protein WBC05_23140 [Sedimentisphaerales bacterium]
MQIKYHALRCIAIVALFCSIADGATNSKKPPLSDQTFKAIRDYMDRVSAPWPDEWNKEYVETI